MENAQSSCVHPLVPKCIMIDLNGHTKCTGKWQGDSSRKILRRLGQNVSARVNLSRAIENKVVPFWGDLEERYLGDQVREEYSLLCGGAVVLLKNAASDIVETSLMDELSTENASSTSVHRPKRRFSAAIQRGNDCPGTAITPQKKLRTVDAAEMAKVISYVKKH